MQHHVADVRHPLLDQLIAHLRRKGTSVLRQDKQVQQLTLGSCRFHQIPMSVGEWIAVHHRCTNHTAVVLWVLQAADISADAVPHIFHEQHVLCLDNGEKSKVGKHRNILRFGKDKQMAVALFDGVVHQQGDHPRGKSFSLMAVVHRHTFDDVLL